MRDSAELEAKRHLNIGLLFVQPLLGLASRGRCGCRSAGLETAVSRDNPKTRLRERR